MNPVNFKEALDVARIVLKNTSPITTSDLQKAVQKARLLYPDVDQQALLDELERNFTVFIGEETSLENNEDHVPWLEHRKADITWDFWHRYEHYLEEEKDMPHHVMRSLDRLSDDILGRLEDPIERTGSWYRRGMVVGHVQSGKTSNYTALICKAADAGYKLIVVLAGRHNSLRSQTQLRIDEGFLGFDTQAARAQKDGKRIGAGLLKGVKHPYVDSLTSSADDGDFTKKWADKTIGHLGKIPVVLVIKKVKSILESFHKWCSVQAVNDPDGKKVVRDLPILVIDDEADDASINTLAGEDSDPETDVSAINRAIRKIMHLFEKRAYVAYTATPFANIFITDEAESEKLGPDLFPKHFIVNLPAPSNYVGPSRVFGQPEDEEEPAKPLPLRMVQQLDHDWQAWLPQGHKKGHTPGELPESLKKAIRVFVLTCAARHARGQTTAHNSMLIHVTRFTDVQKEVWKQVDEHLGNLKQRLRRGDGSSPHSILHELEQLWQDEFVPSLHDPLTWDQVKNSLGHAVQKIEVKQINGLAPDTLQYYDKRHVGLSVVAVGGDKLSRGLTLEGLSVSYYLRASRMYDTLMQMGRWFGYRPGYLDLCRLYTTEELVSWYTHITLASDELRADFDEMAAKGMTPADFGLKVRTHPAGLKITAANKMRHGTKMKVSFSGNISETTTFNANPGIRAENQRHLEQFLRSLPDGQTSEGQETTVLWHDVHPSSVIEFLQNYRLHQGNNKIRSDLFINYISNRNAAGELLEWTVALVSNSTKEHGTLQLAGHEVGWVKRQIVTGGEVLSIKRLLSPTDEYLDLGKPEREQALEITIQNWEKKKEPKSARQPDRPSGKAARQVRPSSRGLLLIYPVKLMPGEGLSSQDSEPVEVFGFGISFPHARDDKNAAIEYVVNTVYWESEFAEA